MTTIAVAPDFQTLFQSLPGMYLVIARDLSIVAANDTHLASTLCTRDQIVGMNVFDAFPDNPDDPDADGVQNLRASLARVLRFRVPDQMAIQRYAIRRVGGAGGTGVFMQRYRKILNSPVRGEDGTVQYIINHAEDVTELHELSEQQRVSAALLRRQEELRVSQEVARVGSFEWNIETGVIEWFAGESLYGLPVGGLDSFEAWTKRIHPEDRPIAERAVRVAMETGEFNGEWRSIWPDGSVHWLAMRGTVSRNAAGKPLRMVGATIDITVRKEADLFRTQLAAIVDSSDDAIISRSLDGTILSWNMSAERIFGYTAEEIVGRGLMLLVPPDKVEEETVAIAERLRRGEGVDHIESVRVTKDGRRIDVSITLSPMRDGSGKVVAASMVCRDITTQKEADLLRTQLAAIVDSSDDAIISRSLDGTILSWNMSAERIFGYTAEEIVGKGLMLLVPPDKVEEEEVAIAERLRRGEGVDHIESVRVTKAGKRIDVSITLSPMRDGSGKVVAASMVCRDITTQKNIEAQAALANRELEAFSYSVSHDLRAPLRGIDGWSLALKEDFADKLDARGLGYLDRVRSETQRMGTLIDDLLRLSSITQAQLRPTRVDLSALAHAAEGRLRESSPARQVEFVIEPGLFVRGDTGLVNAALTNLIDNAWKFTGKKPSARIELGRIEKDGKPAFFLRDNGAGFDMTFASKLFSPFQRAHKTSEFPGTGVGLATVQRVMLRHGGRIWVESIVDEGTTFFFVLENCA